MEDKQQQQKLSTRKKPHPPPMPFFLFLIVECFFGVCECVASSRFPSSSVRSVVSHTHTHQRRTQNKKFQTRNAQQKFLTCGGRKQQKYGAQFSFQLSPLFFLFFRKHKKIKHKEKEKKEWASFSVVVPPFSSNFTPDIFCLVLFCFHSQRICVLGASCSFRGSNNKQQNVYQIRA